MRVAILIEFDVESAEPSDDADDEKDENGNLALDENAARNAAEQATIDFLTFCTVSGVNTDTDEVEVHAEGFGTCKVRLAN